jgi:hypothetical protein
MDRAGIEPAASSMPRKRSTPDLSAQLYYIGRGRIKRMGVLTRRRGDADCPWISVGSLLSLHLPVRERDIFHRRAALHRREERSIHFIDSRLVRRRRRANSIAFARIQAVGRATAPLEDLHQSEPFSQGRFCWNTERLVRINVGGKDGARIDGDHPEMLEAPCLFNCFRISCTRSRASCKEGCCRMRPPFIQERRRGVPSAGAGLPMSCT